MKTPFYIKILLTISIIIIFAQQDLQSCTNKALIEAEPNPATHYVEFTYQLSDIDKEGIIMITDMNGKQIQSFTLKYSKGIQAWDTRKVPAGSYVYTLKTKYFEKSAKLIINH